MHSAEVNAIYGVFKKQINWCVVIRTDAKLVPKTSDWNKWNANKSVIISEDLTEQVDSKI